MAGIDSAETVYPAFGFANDVIAIRNQRGDNGGVAPTSHGTPTVNTPPSSPPGSPPSCPSHSHPSPPPLPDGWGRRDARTW